VRSSAWAPSLLAERATRCLIIGVSLSLLFGCVADVKLRHPQTGKTAVCEGGYCPGVICLPAQDRQFRCIDDYQRQGYERVPD
jgi:hypothetical protein